MPRVTSEVAAVRFQWSVLTLVLSSLTLRVTEVSPASAAPTGLVAQPDPVDPLAPLATMVLRYKTTRPNTHTHPSSHACSVRSVSTYRGQFGLVISEHFAI